MSVPKLSVVLPVFNAEKYLEQSIVSVLNQSFEDFEFIIINDGSTDNSLDIIKKYSVLDNRILVHDKKNTGLIETLNLGISLAKSELIARMDSDDICLTDRFKKQIDFLQNNQDCVALGSRVIVIDADGDEICNHWWSLTSHAEIDAANLTGNVGSAMCHPSVVFRKSAVLAIGGYSKDYLHAEDLDLFLRLAEIGKLANMSECLLKYRIHHQSVSHANKKIQLESTRNAICAARKRRNLMGVESLESDSGKLEGDNPSIHERYLSWGWMALLSGYKATAAKYLKKLIITKPFNLSTWSLMFALLKSVVFRAEEN